MPHTRLTFAYDAGGSVLSRLLETTNGTGVALIANSRDIYTYDATGNELSRTSETWNEMDSRWIVLSRSRFNYSNAGLRISQVDEETYNGAFDNWDSVQLSTMPTSQTTVYYKWDGTAWQLHERQTAALDNTGNMTSSIYQNWDGAAWQNKNRSLYDYNGFKQLTREQSQSWINGAWGLSPAPYSSSTSRYYYETFTAPDTAMTPRCQVRLRIWPVPVDGHCA